MPAPFGTDQPLAQFLADIEDRLGTVESPQGPILAYPMASASLTVANAATNINRIVIVTDLKTLAYSTGVHWVRVDTGANII